MSTMQQEPTEPADSTVNVECWGSDDEFPDSKLCEEDEAAEQEHLARVVAAFRYYRAHSIREVERVRRNWAQVQEDDLARLPGYGANAQQRCSERQDGISAALETNGAFLDEMLRQHSVVGRQIDCSGAAAERPSDFDMGKVRSTIRQFVREWSAEGEPERMSCFGPISQELVRRLKPFNPSKLARVLVPGAGLGRLPYEIARLGYDCQGNEFSYFMLLGSNFILNRLESEPLSLQPWVHQYSNSLSLADQLRLLKIPDVIPADEPPPGEFSMCAGDFVEIYSSQPSEWDAIVTCFFVDTAPNIFNYVRTIHTALRNDGVWINFGPLLYHFEDNPAEMSIELSLEELLAVVASFGFEIVQNQRGLSCNYTTNCRSLMQTQYNCAFFTAIKRA